MKKNKSRGVLILCCALALAVLLLIGGFYAAKWHFGRQLPPVATLRELKLQVPLRVYTADGKLIGEFGAERRAPMRYEQMPRQIIEAFLSAEDDRFFEHPGVDWQGLLRAGFKLATTGEKSQGGSTITMQLARNVFLSSERSFTRKFKEILLAVRIEKEMSKQQILETYLNKIFLGQRAYGIGAASQVYFGREPKDLTLAQAAMLAGLPKAPSRDNPVSNPTRAKERRDYVLRRMRSLNKISELDFQAALVEPVVVKFSLPEVEADAHYVAEMARAELFSKYGEAAYTGGYRVTTTVDSARQAAANGALRRALTDYDERHGWRGAETRLPEALMSQTSGTTRGGIEAFLDGRPVAAGLLPGVVVAFQPESLRVLTRGQGLVELSRDDFKWAGFTDKKKLAVGDIVRIRRVGERWKLAQLPQAEGAFVALDPRDGAVQALIGGYDFLENKYNRVMQARRQPGSGFKPFLYSAALNFGFTPASVILDAPVVFDDSQQETTWRPENYGGDFKGPMRLREALVQSRNLVSVRLLQAIGIDYAQNYAARFGLAKDRMPKDLSMALGSATYTPMEMASAYAVIANGGFLVTPYFIAKIEDAKGTEIFHAQPRIACPDCAEQIVQQSTAAAAPPAATLPSGENLAPRAIEPQTIWLITDILRDVAVRGTAAKARELGRNDIAGKTGTTNDETDAWFYGFSTTLVGVSWVGFDQPTPLGRGEVGGRSALPMWIDFMRSALKGVPQQTLPQPPGLVEVRINPKTGRLASASDGGAMFETVQADHVPAAEADGATPAGRNSTEDLF